MSKYYIVPSLNDERVFISYNDAKEFLLEDVFDEFEGLTESEVAELVKEAIEETDYFEDLDKAQQNYLLDI